MLEFLLSIRFDVSGSGCFYARSTNGRLIQIRLQQKRGGACRRSHPSICYFLYRLRLLEKLFLELFSGHRTERQTVVLPDDLDLALFSHLTLDRYSLRYGSGDADRHLGVFEIFRGKQLLKTILIAEVKA